MYNSKKPKGNDATMFRHSKVEEMFNLVKTDKGIIITCGKYKISMKSFKTWKEAENYIASKPYEILINVSVLMCKLNENEKEQKENLGEGKENA